MHVDLVVSHTIRGIVIGMSIIHFLLEIGGCYV